MGFKDTAKNNYANWGIKRFAIYAVNKSDLNLIFEPDASKERVGKIIHSLPTDENWIVLSTYDSFL